MTNRKFRGLPRVAVLALVAVVLLACGPSPGDRPDILLISIDTLRPDHLGCFGAEPSPTPALDDLCREALVFEQAIAQAPSTLPSHASMFTSLVPQHHGASFAAQRPLADGHVTLAEVLAEAGYRTAAFHDGGQIAGVWGLGQGFEVYEELGLDRFEAVIERGLAWLDGLGADEPFFLFLHTYEVHAPYTPTEADLAAIEEMRGGEPYEGWLGGTVGIRELRRLNRDLDSTAPADRRHVRAAYDAEILSMDRALGELIAGLRARGLWDDTVVVFTSDHGEEMGEHGQIGRHSHTLYDELLRVPLVWKPAGETVPGRRVRPMVRSVDIAPTLLDTAGVTAPDAFTGRSLLPLVAGRDGAPPWAVAQLDAAGPTPPEALRGPRWKLFDTRLYDLQRDPGESRNVAGRHPEIVRELSAALERLTAADPDAPGAEADRIDLDAETRERLEALGYL